MEKYRVSIRLSNLYDPVGLVAVIDTGQSISRMDYEGLSICQGEGGNLISALEAAVMKASAFIPRSHHRPALIRLRIGSSLETASSQEISEDLKAELGEEGRIELAETKIIFQLEEAE